MLMLDAASRLHHNKLGNILCQNLIEEHGRSIDFCQIIPPTQRTHPSAGNPNALLIASRGDFKKGRETSAFTHLDSSRRRNIWAGRPQISDSATIRAINVRQRMDSCLNRNPDVPTIKEGGCTKNYDRGCVNRTCDHPCISSIKSHSIPPSRLSRLPHLCPNSNR